MSDYAVEIKIKNGRVLRLMRRAGIASITEMSRKSGVSLKVIYDLISLKRAPLSRITGDWKPSIKMLSDALNCLPDDMFSDAQRAGYMQSNKRTVEMSQEEVDLLLDKNHEQMSLDDAVYAAERTDKIGKLIGEMLTPREVSVIKNRFGFGGNDEKTLEEVAKMQGVSKERLRQIEAKALRKLKKNQNKERFDALL